MRKRNYLCMTLAAVLAASIMMNVPAAVAEEEANLPVNEAGEPDPYGKYGEPITVETVLAVDPTNTYGEDQTTTDNNYTRYIKDNINIDIRYKWQVSVGDMDQKRNLAIASNDLPDIMVVTEGQLRKLVESEMVEDLSTYYDTYASDVLKSAIEGNKYAVDSVTYDEGMYAIPGSSVGRNDYQILWIRQDWLDTLGLEAPKTLEDLEAVAKAFVDNNMGGEHTIGILGPDSSSPLHTSFLGVNLSYTLDPIFSAYGSYPGFWLKDEDGKAVYGSITDSTRTALIELNKMYEDGILDEEIGIRSSSAEAWKSGQAGILFFPWWFGYSIMDCIANNPEASWQAYALPTSEDGMWNIKTGSGVDNYIVVRKGYEHPEAAFILLNYMKKYQDDGEDILAYPIDMWPCRIVDDPYDLLDVILVQMRKALAGEELDELTPGLYAGVDSDVQGALESKLEPYDDMHTEYWNTEAPAFARTFSILNGHGAVVDALDAGNVNVIESVLYSYTDTMEQRWTNLQDKENEVFLRIIIGEDPIEAFDTFVEEWKAEGGDQILQEVQEVIDK